MWGIEILSWKQLSGLMYLLAGSGSPVESCSFPLYKVEGRHHGVGAGPVGALFLSFPIGVALAA